MAQKVTSAKVNAAAMNAVKAGLGGVIASALTIILLVQLLAQVLHLILV
jgi:hypothetical protein